MGTPTKTPKPHAHFSEALLMDSIRREFAEIVWLLTHETARP